MTRILMPCIATVLILVSVAQASGDSVIDFSLLAESSDSGRVVWRIDGDGVSTNLYALELESERPSAPFPFRTLALEVLGPWRLYKFNESGRAESYIKLYAHGRYSVVTDDVTETYAKLQGSTLSLLSYDGRLIWSRDDAYRTYPVKLQSGCWLTPDGPDMDFGYRGRSRAFCSGDGPSQEWGLGFLGRVVPGSCDEYVYGLTPGGDPEGQFPVANPAAIVALAHDGSEQWRRETGLCSSATDLSVGCGVVASFVRRLPPPEADDRRAQQEVSHFVVWDSNGDDLGSFELNGRCLAGKCASASAAPVACATVREWENLHCVGQRLITYVDGIFTESSLRFPSGAWPVVDLALSPDGRLLALKVSYQRVYVLTVGGKALAMSSIPKGAAIRWVGSTTLLVRGDAEASLLEFTDSGGAP